MIMIVLHSQSHIAIHAHIVIVTEIVTYQAVLYE